jgi:hypothetical protein
MEGDICILSLANRLPQWTGVPNSQSPIPVTENDSVMIFIRSADLHDLRADEGDQKTNEDRCATKRSVRNDDLNTAITNHH